MNKVYNNQKTLKYVYTMHNKKNTSIYDAAK